MHKTRQRERKSGEGMRMYEEMGKMKEGGTGRREWGGNKKSVNRDAGKMSEWKREAEGRDKGIRELEREEDEGREEKRSEERRGEEERKERRIPKMYSELVLPNETGSSGWEILWGKDFCACVHVRVC